MYRLPVRVRVQVPVICMSTSTGNWFFMSTSTGLQIWVRVSDYVLSCKQQFFILVTDKGLNA